jgi:hypothetical protein
VSRYCTQPQIRFIMSMIIWTTTLEKITLMINLDNYFISVPQYSNYPNWNGACLIYNISLSFTSLHHSTILTATCIPRHAHRASHWNHATPVTLVIFHVVVRVFNRESSSQTVGPLGASYHQYMSFNQYHQFAGSPALLFVYTNCGTVNTVRPINYKTKTITFS